MKDQKDLGAVSATEADAVSCSVPTDAASHAAPEKLVRLTREDEYEKRWIVVGKHGAIDFHCSHAHLEISRKYGVTGGVEYHHRAPASYMGADYSCTDDHCWVLGGKCWFDGTSLWASEHWIPMLRSCGEDWVWRELETTYRQQEWNQIGSGNTASPENSATTSRSEAP